MDKLAIYESVKELARIVVFAAVAAAVTAALDYLAGLNSAELWVIVLTAALRFADKYIHTAEGIKANGLVPF